MPSIYNKYSDYLKKLYGEKVYKLPINLPITCPNRLDNQGCIFCSDVGTGFESQDENMSITNQLETTKVLVQKKYHAHKFIAYFQNYTNTFMSLEVFAACMEEAAKVSDIVEISISTRPDCIHPDYLDILTNIKEKYGIAITIELGLQTTNCHTLKFIRRGHSLAEFIDAVLTIQAYKFTICAHIILNLPGDTIEDSIEIAKVLSALHVHIVKIHSLYIAKNSDLSELYERGDITICTKEEYIERLIICLEYLAPTIVVERLFSRIPEKDAVFSNWETSWWKLQDEVLSIMESRESVQGKSYNYLQGAALRNLT